MELHQSVAGSGTYSLLNCWCGTPECAGIYEGVQVTHSQKPGQNSVEWIISQPEPRRVFTFDSKGYERAITCGIEQIRRDVANLWFTAAGEKDEKLQIVPGWDEDMALIEPKAQTNVTRRQRNE